MVILMETRTSQTIKSGIKNNSMYEKAVICDATVDETNKYYATAEQLQSSCDNILEPMPIFDVSNVKYNGPKLIIEIPDNAYVLKKIK